MAKSFTVALALKVRFATPTRSISGASPGGRDGLCGRPLRIHGAGLPGARTEISSFAASRTRDQVPKFGAVVVRLFQRDHVERFTFAFASNSSSGSP